MEQFVISKQTLTAVLSYLAKRPYIEVAELVEQVKKVTPLPKAAENVEEEKKPQ